jgi:hypothetical protein
MPSWVSQGVLKGATGATGSSAPYLSDAITTATDSEISLIYLADCCNNLNDGVSTAAGSEISLIASSDTTGVLSDAVSPATGSEISLIASP